MPKVSFARGIRQFFRNVDISRVAAQGIKLDDYTEAQEDEQLMTRTPS
jgi:hypothetical protein